MRVHCRGCKTLLQPQAAELVADELRFAGCQRLNAQLNRQLACISSLCGLELLLWLGKLMLFIRLLLLRPRRLLRLL